LFCENAEEGIVNHAETVLLGSLRSPARACDSSASNPFDRLRYSTARDAARRDAPLAGVML
jgi:hypothetical protein